MDNNGPAAHCGRDACASRDSARASGVASRDCGDASVIEGCEYRGPAFQSSSSTAASAGQQMVSRSPIS